MALYYFILKNGRQAIPDCDGVELPDEATARHYAETIARELMRNREDNTRSWRVEVCDEDLEPRFDVLFASIDAALSHLPAEWQESIQEICRKTETWADTITNVEATPSEVRITLRRTG